MVLALAAAFGVTAGTGLSSAYAEPATKGISKPPQTVLQYKSDLVSASKLNSLPARLVTPLAAVTNKNVLYSSGCHSMGNQPGANPENCEFGTPGGKYKIWLIGDSHASQWFTALETFAVARGASLTVHTKSSCPIMTGLPFYPNTTKPYVPCQDYNDWVYAQITAANPDLLLVANYQGLERLYISQVGNGLDRLATVAKRVILLGDTPKQLGLLPPCLQKQPRAIQKCAVPLSRAYFPQVTDGVQRAAQRNGYGYVDPRSWFCTATVCPPIIANRVIYADATHISIDASKYFSNRMAMALNAQIQPAQK
jgi:hypothetical protein